MEPITIVSSALSILKATGLSSWIGEKLGIGESSANKIVEIAQAVTGTSDPEKALEAMSQSAAAQVEVRNKLIDNKQEIIRLQYQDRSDARDMYKNSDHKKADDIASVIMKYNLPLIVLLLVANVVAVQFIQNTAVAVAVGNLIGGSVAAMWQERQQVVGFFFGSSIGSKDKTKALAGAKPLEK